MLKIAWLISEIMKKTQMRIAILSDIHGNAFAIEAVIADAKKTRRRANMGRPGVFPNDFQSSTNFHGFDNGDNF